MCRTRGLAAAAQAWLIVWCKRCSRQIDSDPAELVDRHGEAPTVIEWVARLVCSRCGAREADFIVTEARIRRRKLRGRKAADCGRAGGVSY